MPLKATLGETADDIVDAANAFAAKRFRGPRRVATADGQGIAVYEVSARGEAKRLRGAETGSRKPGRDAGELRLPAGAVLARDLTLPAATRSYLDPVIEHRLEKLVPWSPDRVVYGYAVTGAADDGSLAVRFEAASRDVAEDWIARARAAGFSPTAVGAGAVGEPLAVDLMRGALDEGRERMRRGLAIAAAAALAVALPACAYSFWSLAGSEARVAALESRSDAARRAIRLAEAGGAREAALLGAKTEAASVAVLIDRLASAIPDGAVLRELEIDPEKVRLAGASNAAPELIGALAEANAVRGARFAAPVTRDAGGKDTFEILAERRPPEPRNGVAR